MATGVQESGPLLGDPYTDDQYDTIHGAQMGIVGDTDGSAFSLTLPPEGSTAELGSATVDSHARAAGRGLRIPRGTTQSLDIPASFGGGTNGRTDLIVARCDLTSFAIDPGPVRLYRIEGVEGSLELPSYDPATDLRLHAVRRREGESLNQAIPIDLRSWTADPILVSPTGTLPEPAPLGTRAKRGDTIYHREMVGSSPDWVVEWNARTVLTGTGVASDGADYDVRSASRLSREGVKRWMNLVVGLAGEPANPDPEVDDERRIGRLVPSDRPSASVALAGFAQNTAGGVRAAAGRIDPDGWVVWHWASTTNRFPTGSTITLTGRWETAA